MFGRAACRARGLQATWVSGGGTPTERWQASEHTAVLTEVRVGTYVYGDRMCMADASVTAGDCALRVRATVVSRPTETRAILPSGGEELR